MTAFKETFPAEILEHCYDRLVDRHGLPNEFQAELLYFRHHGMLLNGLGEPLYHKQRKRDYYKSTVFRLRDGNQVFYPARCFNEKREGDITLTYLSESMVTDNLIKLYIKGTMLDEHTLIT